MKLLRVGAPGAEKPAVLDAAGQARDLSAHVADLSGAALSQSSLTKLRGLDPTTLPMVPAGTRIGPCVAGTRNFIAIGLNYADHAAETGAQVPAEPIVFNKAPSCIVGPNDDIWIPRTSVKTDWEVELAIIIGDGGSYISEADAQNHIAGYALCNDVSERAFQNERAGQWTKGKGCPTFGPVGPWLVTPDEIANLQALDMFLDVNGERRQTGNTRTMVFGALFLVSYLSQFMKLEPGDIITTGTPPGVGLGMKPPKFLKAGDTCHLGIAGLGEQRQRFVATPAG